MVQPEVMGLFRTGRHRGYRSGARPRSAHSPVLASVIVGALMIVTAVVWAWPAVPPSTAPAPLSPTTALPEALDQGGATTLGAPPPSTGRLHAEVEWRQVLEALDARRAEAFAADRPNLLRSVYLAGSAALAKDRSLMRAYRVRGLRLTRLRTQVLELQVLGAQKDRAVLQVVDQVDEAVVATAGRRTPLPDDEPSTSRIQMVRVAAGWRIARISAAD